MAVLVDNLRGTNGQIYLAPAHGYTIMPMNNNIVRVIQRLHVNSTELIILFDGNFLLQKDGG